MLWLVRDGANETNQKNKTKYQNTPSKVVLTYIWVGYNNHNVRIGREKVNNYRVVSIFDLNRLERRVKFTTKRFKICLI